MACGVFCWWVVEAFLTIWTVMRRGGMTASKGSRVYRHRQRVLTCFHPRLIALARDKLISCHDAIFQNRYCTQITSYTQHCRTGPPKISAPLERQSVNNNP